MTPARVLSVNTGPARELPGSSPENLTTSGIDINEALVAGDPIEVEHRPAHDVTVSAMFGSA